MNKNFIHYFIIVCFCVQTSFYAQTNFSDFALIGKGDLVLVGEDIKLQPEAYKAYEAMRSAALKEGISIQIISGYRSFGRQKQIWNRKYAKFISKGMKPQKVNEKIIEYSTIPGTSRHHWGTEIDIIDRNAHLEKSYLTEDNFSGEGAYVKLKKWMDLNAEKFGFYLVYTKKSTRKGFKYEPWHYSYKNLSKRCLKYFLKMDLQLLMNNKAIDGSEFFSDDFVEKYVSENILDINPKLK